MRGRISCSVFEMFTSFPRSRRNPICDKKYGGNAASHSLDPPPCSSGQEEKNLQVELFTLISTPFFPCRSSFFSSFFRCLETTNKKKHPLRVNLEWIVDSARTRKADQDVCEKRHSEPDLINAPPSDIKENLRRFVKSFTSLFSWFGIHSPLPSPFQFRIAP